MEKREKKRRKGEHSLQIISFHLISFQTQLKQTQNKSQKYNINKTAIIIIVFSAKQSLID